LILRYDVVGGWDSAHRAKDGISPFIDIRRLSRRLGYPIQILFDVGANIGQTAQKVLDAFPSVSVVCFEPHPATFT
jgi:hypothetical protein